MYACTGSCVSWAHNRPGKSKEEAGSLGTRAAGCEQPLGPLQGQLGLLTTEPPPGFRFDILKTIHVIHIKTNDKSNVITLVMQKNI